MKSEDVVLTGEPAGSDTARFGKRERKAAVKAFSRCHLGVFIYFIVSTAVILGIELALMLIFGENRATALLDNVYVTWGMQVLSMYVIAFPVFLLIVRAIPRASRDKAPMTLAEFVTLFLVCQGVMTAGALISNFITEYLSGLLGYDVVNTTSDIIMETPLWVVILVAVIIGPIVEEMIFRKAFIDRLSVYGDRLAIFVSSMAFGLFHGNLSQLIYATALGFIFGYIYTKTRRIRYSCIMHMLVNFMGTVPSMSVMDSIDRLSALDPEAAISGSDAFLYLSDSVAVLGVTLVQYGLAIAGIVILVRMIFRSIYRHGESTMTCDVKIPVRHMLRVTVFNIGTLLFLIMCAIQVATSLMPPL